MKFMAQQPFTSPHQQAIGADLGLSVAQAERSASGTEGKDSSHGMNLLLFIQQGLPQQQQAATFGDDRQAGVGGTPEILQAASVVGQLAGM